ncbi:MAG: hypothetical protein CL534_15915 [Ahrensia sp.]|nr:hypothetical protein [Ahrensia sp.]
MYPKNTTAAGWPFRDVVRGVSDYRRRQRDYRKLRDMPDALLDDIGVTRDQIGRVKRWSLF